MDAKILSHGLSRRAANRLAKAGVPIEKEAVIKALKNGTLRVHQFPPQYGKYLHREVCRWAGIDERTLPPFIPDP
jgi:hypothetical protein